MTIADRRTMTAQGVLEDVRALGPSIVNRSIEIETARRIPHDLLDELIRTGCFALLLPPSHGGVAADLAAALRVFETLARADASVGWTVMIGASAWVDLAGIPRAAFDRLFPVDRQVIVAGAFNPAGQISGGNKGYRVTGRWGFSSGCEHADWLWGNCIEGTVDGDPQLRGAVFSPDQVVIEDTWTSSGLRGTGSHHFHATDVEVPTEMTFPVDADDPCLDEVVVHVPVPALLSVAIASVAIGTAQGALDDIVALAADKVPLLDPASLASNPHFQIELATADTEVRAARAVLYETTEAMWATATARGSLTLEQRARIRATAVWATERAAAAVGRRLPRGRRHLCLRRLPPPAPSARHPNHDPALPSQARHPQDRRRHPRRPGSAGHGVLTRPSHRNLNSGG